MPTQATKILHCAGRILWTIQPNFEFILSHGVWSEAMCYMYSALDMTFAEDLPQQLDFEGASA